MTKLAGDHVQVLVDGYELTGDHNSINLSEARDMHDVTAFGDEVHKFIPARRNITLDHAGYLNPDAGRSHPVLKDVNVNGIVSVLVGENAAPADGDIMYSLPVLQGMYQSQTDNAAFVPFAAKFASQADRTGWGRAVAVPVSFTNSSNSLGVDGGAATNGGGVAILHILTAAASDTYSITVEGAANSTFTDTLVTLATFTLDASALGSERIAIPTWISRYTRWKAVRTGTAGDTVRIAVNLVRF